jgi:Flp pilus assembly protein TadG
MRCHLRHIRSYLAGFFAEQRGVAMTEAIVAVPFLFFLAVGVLEFGALFWQREQIETGLRDAARYMARCRHVPTTICETTALNLAYYGTSEITPLPPLRAPDWNAANSLITFTQTPIGTQVIVEAETTHDLVNSPFLGLFGVGPISITASHNQRVMGW